jgi:hypothetical protein
MAISRGALPPLDLLVTLTNRSILRAARGEVKRIGDAR